jgi:hypothetical protein
LSFCTNQSLLLLHCFSCSQLKSRKIKGTSGGTAFQLGACKDSQVAADTNAMSGSAYTGAATFSFIDAVEKYGTNQTYAT